MCREMEKIYSEGMESGEKRGIEKGELKKAKETALSMAEEGMDVKTIARLVKISEKDVQKWIDETNLHARRFSAEHGKALLRIFADFDGGRGFLPLSWLSHALNAFHAVNAIGQHLSLFFVVAKQIIVPVVDKQPVWADNVIRTLAPLSRLA